MRRRRELVTAVAGIDLQIERGAMVGYIGPNGAGKSTTIKMLTGILVPTAGRVRVDGLEPSRSRTELAQRIGVVFGQRSQLWWDLPLRDSFDLLRHVYRVPAERHAANLDRFTEGLDLGPLLDVPVRQLSLGQRMRGELTAALAPRPGDPPARRAHHRARRRSARRRCASSWWRSTATGTTVLLTTHDLTDVERLCERLLIIDHGLLIEDGTRGRDHRALRQRADAGRRPGRARGPLQVEGARVTRVEGPRQWLRFRRDDVSASELLSRVTAQVDVRDLSVEEPDIESIVREIYAR